MKWKLFDTEIDLMITALINEHDVNNKTQMWKIFLNKYLMEVV